MEIFFLSGSCLFDEYYDLSMCEFENNCTKVRSNAISSKTAFKLQPILNSDKRVKCEDGAFEFDLFSATGSVNSILRVFLFDRWIEVVTSDTLECISKGLQFIGGSKFDGITPQLLRCKKKAEGERFSQFYRSYCISSFQLVKRMLKT